MKLNELNALVKTTDMVLFSIYKPWNIQSKLLNLELDKFDKITSNDMIVCKLDYRKNQEIIDEYDIKILPSVLFFKNGFKCEKFEGYKDLAYLKELYNRYL